MKTYLYLHDIEYVQYMHPPSKSMGNIEKYR